MILHLESWKMEPQGSNQGTLRWLSVCSRVGSRFPSRDAHIVRACQSVGANGLPHKFWPWLFIWKI